ncbi:MAG: alpha/beta fold hydrolase [Candidatus Nanopelagicales bacterium]
MAPTVVLLHAFPLDKRMWDDVVPAIADAGWDVVVPDLMGFGESRLDEDDLDDPPTLVTQARGVLRILDQVGLPHVVVCGLSMGGYVAMELVRQDPSRIAGIALVDTKATADTEEARANRLRVADQVLESGSTDALARAMLPTLLGDTSRASRPDVVERVTGWIREADPVGVACAQRAMAARPDSLTDLASLKVPGLVLWGAEDTLSPRAEQDLMVEAMRDARLVEIPTSGHLCAVEEPAATAAALVTFLRDVEKLPRHT